MASTGREEMFFKIALFLSIITLIGGTLNLASSGTITLENFGTADGTVPGQLEAYSQYGTGGTSGTYYEGSNTANGSTITDIDFTTAVSINQNVTTTIGSWTLQPSQGLALTGVPILAGTLNPSVVLLRNAMSEGSMYTFNAVVNNIPGQDFYVFPRYITGYSGSDIKVVFSSDGVHVKKFPLNFGFLDAGDDYFYPLTGARDTISGGSTITTSLNETVSSQLSNNPDYSSLLTVSKDGVVLFSVMERSILPGYNINDQVRHGGVGSDTAGFIIKGFPDIMAKDTSDSIISGGLPQQPAKDDWMGWLSTLLSNMVTSIWQLIALFAVFFGLSGSSIMPWWLWCIIGLPCIATLALIQIEIWRGN